MSAQVSRALTRLARDLVLGQVLQLLARRERTPTRRPVRDRGCAHDSIIGRDDRDRGTQTHQIGDPSTRPTRRTCYKPVDSLNPDT